MSFVFLQLFCQSDISKQEGMLSHMASFHEITLGPVGEKNPTILGFLKFSGCFLFCLFVFNQIHPLHNPKCEHLSFSMFFYLLLPQAPPGDPENLSHFPLVWQGLLCQFCPLTSQRGISFSTFPWGMMIINKKGTLGSFLNTYVIPSAEICS